MNYNHYIEKLCLMPHPEGGYYRQVFGNDENGEKQISTIYYMLCDSDFSAFHRLHGMTEIWYYHAGECLDIYVIDANGELVVHHLSADDEMQVVIEPEQWFAAELPGRKGFSLVGCAVAPAFKFENFELAKKDDLLREFPQHRATIERLCR
ncbi:MAG: cupin domain-containing protein [Bacteroidales bacterium]|nr:cupin domain-containing protein [Bacteroidales bacterium]